MRRFGSCCGIAATALVTVEAMNNASPLTAAIGGLALFVLSTMVVQSENDSLALQAIEEKSEYDEQKKDRS